MSDVVDRAADEEEAFINEALRRQRARTPVGNSFSECIECGNAIPALRQLAVVGCVRCVGCQYELECGL